VLTAIQICEAHDRGVLVPWNSWRHEFYRQSRPNVSKLDSGNEGRQLA
jgi:hypothetical protein